MLQGMVSQGRQLLQHQSVSSIKSVASIKNAASVNRAAQIVQRHLSHNRLGGVGGLVKVSPQLNGASSSLRAVLNRSVRHLSHQGVDLAAYSLKYDAAQHAKTAQLRAQFIKSIQQGLLKQGLVILNQYPINEMADFSQLAKTVIQPIMSYEGGTNSRDDIGGGALSVGTEPPFVNVIAHNEMSYFNRYPERIMFGCLMCPPGRGPTMIADNAKITDAIRPTAMGQTLWDHGVTYIRNFYNEATHNEANIETNIETNKKPALRSWQEAFGVQTQEEMAQLCETLGWDFQFDAQGGFKVSYTLPAYEFDPELNKNLLFTSMGNHAVAFDEWPPFNELAPEDRPYHITYGNGEPFSAEDLRTYEAIFNQYETPIHWSTGRVAILDNRRFTHARPPFVMSPGEQRILGVMMGMERERYGQKP